MAHFIKKIIQLAEEYLLDCKTKKEVQIVTLLASLSNFKVKRALCATKNLQPSFVCLFFFKREVKFFLSYQPAHCNKSQFLHQHTGRHTFSFSIDFFFLLLWSQVVNNFFCFIFVRLTLKFNFKIIQMHVIHSIELNYN